MALKNIEFRILREEDFDAVWNIILEEFVKREPNAAIMELNEEEAFSFIGNFTKDALWHSSSLGAFDKRTQQLIGICMCVLGKKPNKYFDMDISECPKKVRRVVTLMLSMLGGAPEEIMGTKDYLQCIVLCSRSKQSNIGIGTELFARLEEIAVAEDCKKIFTIGSSAFTIKICTKLGFKVHKEIFYKEYVDPISGRKIFENIPEPHIKCALLVKTLSDS